MTGMQPHELFWHSRANEFVPAIARRRLSALAA